MDTIFQVFSQNPEYILVTALIFGIVLLLNSVKIAWTGGR